MMSGKLFVVATPIGNIKDITLRALEILKEADLILCEDTRRTRPLLTHYGISNELQSYNEHNERDIIPKIIEMLEDGHNIALVSDAGTPGISDPGYRLVREARIHGIEVVSVPGPSAVIAAISISGLPTDKFVFEGFLPRKKNKRLKRLGFLKNEDRTIIIYESVHRIERTLREILEIMGDREVALCRELTKLHEEVKFGQLSDIIAEGIKEKGEFVIVLRGKDES